MRARQQIADATGLRLDQVKVVLQYGGEVQTRPTTPAVESRETYWDRQAET